MCIAPRSGPPAYYPLGRTKVLRFQMEDTTLYFRPCVNAILEEFVLEPIGSGSTRLTRTTEISVTGIGSYAKALVMCAGMKCVHRYVFKNWAEADAHNTHAPISDTK